MSPRDMGLVVWIQTNLYLYLGACTAYLAVAGQRANLPSQHNPGHTWSIRFAGCSRQQIRPWYPWPRDRHPMNPWAQGSSWLA